MRFGWLAAAAAMVLAVPSSAATWVQYTFSGVGMQHIGDYSGNYTSTRGIVTGRLVVNLDPIDPGLFGYADGASYRYDNAPTLLQASGTAGSLQAELTCVGRGCWGNGVLALRFPGDVGTPGFITASPGSVTGTFNNFFGNLVTTTDYDAANSQLTVEYLANGDAIYDTISFVALPVPEPATWAMMILGIAAMGAQLRRKRMGAMPTIA